MERRVYSKKKRQNGRSRNYLITNSLESMEALNMIREIVSRLTEEEKGTIRLYLRNFNQRGKNSRSIKLFDILTAAPKHSDEPKETREQFETLLYGKGNPATFGRLLLRLKEKILEALIIDVNINREGAYDERTKATIEVRKNLTQIQILQNRGLRTLAESMLGKTIKMARKYEIYEELLLATRLLIQHHTIDHGDKHLKTLLKLYDRADEAKHAVLRAEVNYGRINAELDYRTGQNAKIEWLKEMLDNMLTDFKKTSSSQVGFYYFYIEAQYYQLLGDYKNARKVLEDNLKLLKSKPGVYTKMRLGSVLLNLADNDLYLREFNRCYRIAEESLSYFKETSFNHTQGIELMFYSKYYLGEYEHAENIVIQLLPDSEVTTGISYRIGKRLYLVACTNFMQGDYATCCKLTNRLVNPIEDDKEGWNVGQRILTIMALIELSQLDEATAKILAMKEFLQTIDKISVTDRMRHIYVILQKLSNAGFDFKATYHKEKERIDALETLTWQPRSPEMVIFHQWFFAKVSKQKFSQRIPEYSQKEIAPRKKIVLARSE